MPSRSSLRLQRVINHLSMSNTSSPSTAATNANVISTFNSMSSDQLQNDLLEQCHSISWVENAIHQKVQMSQYYSYVMRPQAPWAYVLFYAIYIGVIFLFTVHVCKANIKGYVSE